MKSSSPPASRCYADALVCPQWRLAPSIVARQAAIAFCACDKHGDTMMIISYCIIDTRLGISLLRFRGRAALAYATKYRVIKMADETIIEENYIAAFDEAVDESVEEAAKCIMARIKAMKRRAQSNKALNIRRAPIYHLENKRIGDAGSKMAR